MQAASLKVKLPGKIINHEYCNEGHFGPHYGTSDISWLDIASRNQYLACHIVRYGLFELLRGYRACWPFESETVRRMYSTLKALYIILTVSYHWLSYSQLSKTCIGFTITTSYGGMWLASHMSHWNITKRFL